MPGRRKGQGFGDWLKSGHDFLKQNKVISRLASHHGYNTAGKIAGALGYGKKRRGSGWADWATNVANTVGGKFGAPTISSGQWAPHVVNWAADKAKSAAGIKRKRRGRGWADWATNIANTVSKPFGAPTISSGQWAPHVIDWAADQARRN